MIKTLGINTVTCYIPWRHHCTQNINNEDTLVFDFIGNMIDSNKNIIRFIQCIHKHHLQLIIRPGPFIHAEVELGGIPDFFSPTFNAFIKPLLHKESMVPLCSEGKILPAVFDPLFLDASIKWIRLVLNEIIKPYAYPKGPIIAVQIGNEGIYSDINWSGNTIHADLYKKYVRIFRDIFLELQMPVLFNTSSYKLGNLFREWIKKTDPSIWVENNLIYGYSHWQGNARTTIESFFSLILAAQRMRGFNIEENAGFDWYPSTTPNGEDIIYHALLHIASGSSGISFYPVVATDITTATIQPNEQYLSTYPERRKYYKTPYGKYAPINIDGNPNHSFLPILTFIRFIKKYYIDNNFSLYNISLLDTQSNIIKKYCSIPMDINFLDNLRKTHAVIFQHIDVSKNITAFFIFNVCSNIDSSCKLTIWSEMALSKHIKITVSIEPQSALLLIVNINEIQLLFSYLCQSQASRLNNAYCQLGAIHYSLSNGSMEHL